MSDYSNYGASDDYSDEDNYAGAYGGYDDLYDEVMEEAGYDAWDIGYEEFGFDEETFLFEFDPFVEYFDMKDDSDVVTMTYQSLVKLTEMTCQLLRAWMKRSSASLGDEQDNKTTQDEPFNWDFGLNLYQLDPKERDELKSYSVAKLVRIFGSDEEVSKFEKTVNQMGKFLRKCLLDILGSCLPHSLPYPVLSTILSHLMAAKGLHKVGLVTKLKSSKMMEMEYMDKLYLSLADVYDHIKVVMFNIYIEPNTHSTEPSLNEKKESVLRRFKILSELVNKFRTEFDLDSLEITSDTETNQGGGMDMFEKLGETSECVGHSDLELMKKIIKGDGQAYPELDEGGQEEEN
eukprot:GFUD01042814.1.p1 GENE.GFUD01042814.1~~GFUD01042814.1.p1  ORF type:complete len:347 (+),score=114.83 GFUD01042814.1:175-1215(+)